jgi:hypothetical protein
MQTKGKQNTRLKKLNKYCLEVGYVKAVLEIKFLFMKPCFNTMLKQSKEMKEKYKNKRRRL